MLVSEQKEKIKDKHLLKTARININILINSNHLVIQLVDSKKMIDTPQMIFFEKLKFQ